MGDRERLPVKHNQSPDLLNDRDSQSCLWETHETFCAGCRTVRYLQSVLAQRHAEWRQGHLLKVRQRPAGRRRHTHRHTHTLMRLLTSADSCLRRHHQGTFSRPLIGSLRDSVQWGLLKFETQVKSKVEFGQNWLF